jgi:hypothetical protein
MMENIISTIVIQVVSFPPFLICISLLSLNSRFRVSLNAFRWPFLHFLVGFWNLHSILRVLLGDFVLIRSNLGWFIAILAILRCFIIIWFILIIVGFVVIGFILNLSIASFIRFRVIIHCFVGFC